MSGADVERVGQKPENPLRSADFWDGDRRGLWKVLGLDTPWLIARARAGEASAREEIRRRVYNQWGLKEPRLTEPRYRKLLQWWFRDFDKRDPALRRRLRRVMRQDTMRVPPPEELAPLFDTHTAPVERLKAGDVTTWEAFLRLQDGFEPSAKRPKGRRKASDRRVVKALEAVVEQLAGPRPIGRPRKVGLPSSDLRHAERVLEKMLIGRRSDTFAQLSTKDTAVLRRVGIEHTLFEAPEPTSYRTLPEILVLATEGEAAVETGWRVRLLVPWQWRHFWHAVDGTVRVWDEGAAEWVDRPVKGRELLQAILRFDTRWTPWEERLRPAQNVTEAQARAEVMMKVEEEIIRLKREGKEPPDSLYEQAFAELGV